jgi:hypothetical protein
MKFCPKSDRKSSRPSIYLQKTASFLGEFDVYQAGERQRFLCTLMQFIELGNGPWRRLFVRLIAEKPVFVNVYGAQESIPRNRFR